MQYGLWCNGDCTASLMDQILEPCELFMYELCGKHVKRAKKDKKQGTNQETLVAARYIRVYQ